MTRAIAGAVAKALQCYVDDYSLIAIVDDESSVGRALARLLRTANYRAEAFDSATEFLGSLAERTPACIVMDLQMPEVTGFELQRELQRLEKRIPVIMITARDEPGTRDHCLALGAACYLSKPIDGETLLASIRAIVRSGRPV